MIKGIFLKFILTVSVLAAGTGMAMAAVTRIN